MVSETYPHADQADRAGGIIVTGAALLSAILVLAGLIYWTGASARSEAGLVAAGCEPSLFVSRLPCETATMMANRYNQIATSTDQQLSSDRAAFRATETKNLSAATAALTAEVQTEQAFDTTLATMTFTPQNRAAAIQANQLAAANGATMPAAAITFTPQVSVIATALIRANQALITLTAEQARSTSVGQLRSFSSRIRAAQAAVAVQVGLIRRALDLPAGASH